MNILNYSIDGVKTITINKNVDERGFFSEVIRKDNNDFTEGEWIKQINLLYSFPGVVKGWHQHLRGQIDYVFVIKGTMKICAYDAEKDDLVEIIGSEENLQVIRIPGFYKHAFQTIGDKPSIALYCTSNVYDNNNPDEIKEKWDSDLIYPKTINGKSNDFRCNQVWRWDYSPNK